MPFGQAPINYIGKKYGRLTIIEDLGCISTGKRRKAKAVCECGVTRDYHMANLTSGNIQSCGCLLVELHYGAEFIGKEIKTEEGKICPQCKEFKSYSEYDKAGKGKIQGRCKGCLSEHKKNRYWSNREVELAKMTVSRFKPENVLQRKEYYQKNKKEYRERHLKYKSDPDKRKMKRDTDRRYHKERYRTDPEYNLLIKIRARIRSALRKQHLNGGKSDKTLAYLGCTYAEFKQHIEAKFTEGMTWEYVLSGEIHVDHIKPCARFTLSDPEQLKACFHYSNVQPLWAFDNLSKNDSYQE